MIIMSPSKWCPVPGSSARQLSMDVRHFKISIPEFFRKVQAAAHLAPAGMDALHEEQASPTLKKLRQQLDAVLTMAGYTMGGYGALAHSISSPELSYPPDTPIAPRHKSC